MRPIELTQQQTTAVITTILGYMPEDIPYSRRTQQDKTALDLVAYLKAKQADAARGNNLWASLDHQHKETTMTVKIEMSIEDALALLAWINQINWNSDDEVLPRWCKAVRTALAEA